MRAEKILSFIMILGLAAMPAFAQRQIQAPPPDDRSREENVFTPDQASRGPVPDERREEIRKKIEAIRIWRLTEELKLDTNTSLKLSALLASTDRKRRDVLSDQMETMRTMRQMLKSQKPDERRIKQLLDKIENNHNIIQELKNSEIKGVKEILNVEQQARFLIFQQEFEREMRETIANARDRGQRPGQRDDRGRVPGGARPGGLVRPPQY